MNKYIGKIKYNPVGSFGIQGDQNSPKNKQSLSLCRQGAFCFLEGNFKKANIYFEQAQSLSSDVLWLYYARAVCHARMGKIEESKRLLDKELDTFNPHENAHRFNNDVQKWLGTAKNTKAVRKENQKYSFTILAVPKPFINQNSIIQWNAIKSWTLLEPIPEIILLGNDKGISEISKEFKLKHIQNIKCNEFGTPLLNSIFEIGQEESSNQVIVYINSDIILKNDFMAAVRTVVDSFEQFLMVGRRWNLNIADLLDFGVYNWQAKLNELIQAEGELHPATGIDYFVFTKKILGKVPSFAIGRTAWDMWLVKRALELDIPVIDATDVTKVIHQNHDYTHLRGGKEEAWRGEESQRNVRLAGGYQTLKGIADATWKLTAEGVLPNKIKDSNEEYNKLQSKGLEYLKVENTGAALNCFKKAIEIKPESAIAYNNLGALYCKLKEWTRAIDCFSSGLRSDPNNKNIVLNYGNLLKYLGKHGQAKKIFTTYLSRNPEDKQIIAALSSIQDSDVSQANTRFLNWENIKQLTSIRLYAGDIPSKKEYNGLIGLSLYQNNNRHIRHDITSPMPLPDNTVDSYQAEDVFEHIEYDKLLPIINEIYRVLKPGGYFRLSVPDYGCDLLINRSVKDNAGNVIFDPEGGGTQEDPGHVWFPRIDKMRALLERSHFAQKGEILYLHYYNMDGTFVVKSIDYSKGFIQRTPDFDKRVQVPYRPMSMVIDLIKL